MQVPLLDLRAQYATLRTEIRAAIDRVCESQQFILGPEVRALEEEIARFCGTQFAVGVSSGTDALLAALMALGVGAEDEVITTPYSFFATVGVIARVGARPVFVDIDPQTFNLDVGAVATRISKKTKVIIPVHLFGLCADMVPLRTLAAEHGLFIVEDAAQALGATDAHGRMAGTTGDIGCFSFFPSKNLGAFGDGGMIVTNNQQLATTLRALRVHGGESKYQYHLIGGNFRLDALQAAILRVKLPYLPVWIEARRRNAQRYRNLFAKPGGTQEIALPCDAPGHIYNQFVIRCSERDTLQQFLRERGVATEVYYPQPLHLQECFLSLGYKYGDFPQAEKAARESLALPIYPEVSAEQQSYVAQLCRTFFLNRTESLV
ncbi:MAG: DegT/DnrJ/EryC1/StrS family aminotransferase [Candidatus Binatia bacterium]